MLVRDDGELEGVADAYWCYGKEGLGREVTYIAEVEDGAGCIDVNFVDG